MQLGPFYKVNNLVLVIYDNEESELARKIQGFFYQNENEIFRRNLKLIVSHTKDISLSNIPIQVNSKNGIFFISSNGVVRAYSQDIKILDYLFPLLDN